MTKLIYILIAIVLFYLGSAFTMWDLTPDFSEVQMHNRFAALMILAVMIAGSYILACEKEE